MRGKSHPELFIAIHNGITVKQLQARGYSARTIYNYRRRYKFDVKPAWDKIIGAV